MKDSSFIHPEIDRALRTTGMSAIRPGSATSIPTIDGPAELDLNSNVIDMTRWMLANLNCGELDGRRILQAATYDALWAPVVQTSMQGARIGLSWFVGERAGHRTIFQWRRGHRFPQLPAAAA